MRPFETITRLDEAEQFIRLHRLAFLYISGSGCSVCHALKPQVQNVMKKYPEIRLAEIDAQEVKEVAGRFSVFTVPVLLFFVEGKEYVREARIVHLDLFDEKVRRVYENVLAWDESGEGI